MKDVWLFVKWQYSKLEFWQKIFIVNFFLMGFTAARTDEVSRYIFIFTIMVPFLYMTKWFLIDSIRASWKKFKEQKANLFNTIKEADNASKSN